MEYIILLVIAVLPVFLIGLFIYRKDKNKESKKLLRKIFLFGVLSCIPACIIELSLDYIFGFNTDNMNLISLFLYSFLVIGLVEEACKFFAAYKVTYNHPEFDEVYDAVVFVAFSCLGFAGFENVLYVLLGGLSTGLLRAIASVPGHICYGIIMGNYMALAKKAKLANNKSLEKKNLFKGLILSSLLHGLFDTCCLGNTFLFIVFVAIIIFIYIYSIKKINKLSKTNEMFVDPNQVNNPIDNQINTSTGQINNPVNNQVNYSINNGVSSQINSPVNNQINISTGQINNLVNNQVNYSINNGVSSQANSPVNNQINTSTGQINNPVNNQVNYSVNNGVSSQINSPVNNQVNGINEVK